MKRSSPPLEPAIKNPLQPLPSQRALRPANKSRRWRCLAILLAAVLTTAGCAMKTAGGAPLPPATAADAAVTRLDLTAAPAAPSATVSEPAPYRLGVGDVLSVSVYGEEGSQREVSVDPNGNITYMLVGTLPAAGRTVDEIRTDLQKLIAPKLLRGVLNVVPKRFGSQTYTILGELNAPGTYLLEGRTTVLDALARAHGIRTGLFRNSTAEMADFQHATLMRHGRLLPLDFEGLLQRGEAAQNRELENGDIITIPSSLVRSIYVLGEVAYPRTIGFFSSVSLLQAITEARGLKSTSDGRVVVIHGSLSRPETRVFDYNQIIKGRAVDVPLSPGDIVYVPPLRFALGRELVEAAIMAYATTVSSQSATKIFQNLNPATQNTQNTIIVP